MRSRRTRSFGEIADIRLLERRADEMRVGRADVVLQEQTRLEAEERERQEVRERRWAERLGGCFDPHLAQAWSSAVNAGAQRLSKAASAVSTAELGKRRAIEALQAAQAKAEAASDLERRARRRDRRAKESRLWLDVADSFIRQADHED